MYVVSVISEFLLYISFSLVMGYFILQVVPEEKRPEMAFPRWLLLLCLLGIIVFSFTPILQIILLLSSNMDITIALKTVLTTYELGKSWLLFAILGLVLLFFNLVSKVEKRSAYLYIFYMGFLLSILSWGSHANSIEPIKGLIYHFTHFLTITVWTGILLQVAWFSKELKNWRLFLKWFTPLAIMCVTIAVAAGFMVMKTGLEPKDYLSSWGLTYGQMLLIKHLFIIPLLFFAFINGFLAKYNWSKREDQHTLSWLKVESLFVSMIFAFTGILGQESPPHNIEETLASEGPSKLFDFIYKDVIQPNLNLSWEFEMSNLFLMFLAIILLGMTFLFYLKKVTTKLAVGMGLLFVLSWYVGLMTSVEDKATLVTTSHESEVLLQDEHIASVKDVSAKAPSELNPFATENIKQFQSKNITRMNTDNPIEAAVQVSQLVFPATHKESQPGTVTLVPLESWQIGLAAAKLIHHPNNGPLLFFTKEGIPAETMAEIRRLNPTGNGWGTQILVMGTVTKNMRTSLAGYKYESIGGVTLAEFASNVDEYFATRTSSVETPYSDGVIIVSSDEAAKLFSLLAINWAAHKQEPILFVTKDDIPLETIEVLKRRENPTIYLVGPEESISNRVQEQLNYFGKVTRISAANPVSASIFFAQYQDEESGFGWGLKGPGHGLTFVPTERPDLAIAAAPLAHLGKHTPLIWLEKEGIPMPIYEFLFTIQPGLSKNTTFGPYNHGYIIGTGHEISFITQGILDEKLEMYHETGVEESGH
jgi:putative copper export protein